MATCSTGSLSEPADKGLVVVHVTPITSLKHNLTFVTGESALSVTQGLIT